MKKYNPMLEHYCYLRYCRATTPRYARFWRKMLIKAYHSIFLYRYQKSESSLEKKNKQKGGDAMKCPLRRVYERDRTKPVMTAFGDCILDCCAEFDKVYKRCIAVSIDEDLRELWRAFDNLARAISQAVLRK